MRQIEGKKSFQPDRGDPSPDLVIEVDITSRSIRRLPIYAALRVPEIWHYSAEYGLRVLLLQEDGEYLENPDSLALKGLGKADVDRFLRVGIETNLGRAAREFKEWLVSLER